MRCSHCGAEVAEGMAMCPTCGFNLAGVGRTAGGGPPMAPPTASIVAPDMTGGGISQPTRPLPGPGAPPTQDRPDPRPLGGETIAAPPTGWPPPASPPPSLSPYGGAPPQPQGAPYLPVAPGSPYGAAAAQPVGSGAYGPAAGAPVGGGAYGPAPGQPPGWTPGQPYPGQYAYPARRPAGILASPAGRAMALLAAGGLLFWLFSFLPWISISGPGRNESSSYKDVIDDLNLSNGYIVVMFLVGAVALGAAALRWRTTQGGDPGWARLAAAAAVGAAVVVTILQFLQHGDLSDRVKASADPQVRGVLDVGMGFALFLLPVACALMAAALWLDRPGAGTARR